ESRPADDLEHVRGCGLLLQRFAQLAQQPRILDGDNGLRGEILHQLDLLLGKREHLLTVNGDRADRFVFLEHRNHKQGTNAGDFDAGDRQRVALQVRWVGTHICNLDRPALLGSARQENVPTTGAVYRSAAPLLDPGRWQIAMNRGRTEAAPFVQPQRAVAGFAELGRLRQHGAEYRIKGTRRT